MGKRYSLGAFEAVRRLLLRQLGQEGQDLFFQMVSLFGEGRRIKVPNFREKGRRMIYYWDDERPYHSVQCFSVLLRRLQQKYGTSAGDEIFNRIVVELGPGRRLTVPTLRSVFRLIRDEQIRSEFRGFNHKELALLYGLSERQVRRIVNGK